MSDPPLREIATLVIASYDWSPNGPARLKRYWFTVVQRDGVLKRFESDRAGWREVVIGRARIRLDNDQIAPVATSIGKPPDHVPVAADDNAGKSGQRDASQSLHLTRGSEV